MIRILVADDQQLFRQAIIRLIEDLSNIAIVGEAANGDDAISQAKALRPDIVLMEVLLGGTGALEATQRIRRIECSPKIIALTRCAQAPYPAQMLKAGASGYLTKNIDKPELVLAIRRVYQGRHYVCNEVAQDLASYAYENHHESPFDILSRREMQISLMVVNCQKVSDISLHLHLSPKTVNSYRYRIFEKLNISSDVELTLLAVRHGMIMGGPKPPLAGLPATFDEYKGQLGTA